MIWPKWFNERRRYRMLEILPGVLVWITLGLAIYFGLRWPVAALAFILIFDVYWFVRIIYLMTYVVIAFLRYRRTIKINWLDKLKTYPAWHDVYHLIFIPTVLEPDAVLRAGLDTITNINYPLDRIIIVFAGEDISFVKQGDVLNKIFDDYRDRFAGFIVSRHPANLPGEITGKGSNTAWAAKEAKKWIDQRGIPYQNIIVSTFDADSVAHEQYFAYLTCTFLDHPNRLHTSYQPIPLFHNNIWDSLPWMRVVSYSTTFWLMGDTQRPDRLFTFSSHSMSWQALVDVGFWQTDVVSEDSRIFLQCLIHYDGNYTVTPMYIPICMDTVQAPSWWQSFKNQYKQIRRWAYGAENFPFMAWNFAANHNMPLGMKLRYLYYQIEGNFSWAVAPILIVLLGWLPFRTNPQFSAGSILAQNAPLALRTLMWAAMIGAIISGVLSILMLPSRPRHISPYQWLTMGFQWLLLPITMILFGSIPAIESQSRLVFGKYLGFWTTTKHR